MVEYRFRKKFKKDSGEIPHRIHRITRGCILKVNCEELGWLPTVCLFTCFPDPNLGVEIIFRNEGTAENSGIDDEIGDIDISVHWYWWMKKILCRACLLFYYFCDKKSRLLTCTCIRSLLHYFDFPSCSLKLGKRFSLRLLCCWCI